MQAPDQMVKKGLTADLTNVINVIYYMLRNMFYTTKIINKVLNKKICYTYISFYYL